MLAITISLSALRLVAKLDTGLTDITRQAPDALCLTRESNFLHQQGLVVDVFLLNRAVLSNEV